MKITEISNIEKVKEEGGIVVATAPNCMPCMLLKNEIEMHPNDTEVFTINAHDILEELQNINAPRSLPIIIAYENGSGRVIDKFELLKEK